MLLPDDFIFQQEVWNQTLGRIEAASGLIMDQLTECGEKFPEMAGTFYLLTAYIGHLHNGIRAITGSSFEMLDFYKRFCERYPIICQCVEGNQSYCKLLDPFVDDLLVEETNICKELWQKYLEALNKEREEIANAFHKVHNKPPVVDPDVMATLLQALKESELLREELRRNHCLVPIV